MHCKKWISLVLSLFLLTACSPNPNRPPNGLTQSAAQSALTGLPLSPALASRRPVAIMINNLKKALPQYGISDAGILYEALAEGGVTRLLAVFDHIEDVKQIGTVRSARPYYLDLAEAHDAIYIHIGGSEAAYSELKARSIDHFDLIRGANDSMYWRDKARIKKSGYEHSVFTSGDRILKKLQNSKIRMTRKEGFDSAFHFTDTMKYDGQPANTVNVPYSSYKTATFTYESKRAQYLVSQYHAPHIDAGKDAPLSVKNVMVLYIHSYVIPGDTKGRLAFDIAGNGRGLYISNGKAVDITWEKASHDRPFLYHTTDGNDLSVCRGNTYVCIVPPGSNVSII